MPGTTLGRFLQLSGGKRPRRTAQADHLATAEFQHFVGVKAVGNQPPRRRTAIVGDFQSHQLT
jgi:hypothetical protein